MTPIFLIKLRQILASPARDGVIVVVAAALLGWTGSWYWIPELFAHFFLQYALLLVILTALLFWTTWGDRERRPWRWAALVATLLVGFVVSPCWLPAPISAAASNASSHHPLNILQFNAAQNTDALVQWLIRHRKEVDVILVLEADTGFAAGIGALAEEFPHHIERLQDDPFGIALLSRYPLNDAEVLELIEDFPALAAHVITPAGPLHIVGIHPPPPVNEGLAKERDFLMKKLAGELLPQLKEGEPTLVFGDFNATVWSPRLRDFIAETGLRDAGQGQGALGTWPALTARGSGFFGIPIDLMLVSEQVMVQERDTGEYLGSDHLPVITRVTY